MLMQVLLMNFCNFLSVQVCFMVNTQNRSHPAYWQTFGDHCTAADHARKKSKEQVRSNTGSDLKTLFAG
jgi:hypothetical protein